MDFSPHVSLAGLLVGLVVGLTGMGGGALMTPILVLVFGVPPLAAVSSDLVASVAMKPVGAGVHLSRGTVHRGLVRWLVVGSVPAAFGGVLLLRFLGDPATLQDRVRFLLGVALLVASVALVAKDALFRRPAYEDGIASLRVRPLPTLAIGVLGGLVVGMTSVGSGSLMMLLLLVTYPRLRLSELVGTDLVQAVPLVASAALAHVLYGHVELGLTASILVGALPGVYVGARFSARASDAVIRPALVVVLLASSLKLLGASSVVMAWASVLLVTGGGAWAFIAWSRRRPAHAETLEAAPSVR